MYRQSEKKLFKSNISYTCPHNMVNVCPLTDEIGWWVWGYPSKFQRVSRVDFVTAPTSLNGGQANFVRCLAVPWGGTLSIHFGSCCPLTEFCRVQNSLCVQVLRAPACYCTALEQWALARLCDVVSSRDRAAIPFDIERSSCLVYDTLEDDTSRQMYNYLI